MTQTLAYIHPDAKIASNVTIDPFTVIHANVEIGEGCWIGSNVTIFPGARIGKNCRIFPGAVISAIPQDLKFDGEDTITVIGDNTTIRECVTINRGTKEKFQTAVGSNCLLMAYVHIAHDCVVGNHCVIANSVQVAGHVEIGDFARLGGACAIHQFVKVGKHVMVSGGSLIRKDVPPYTKAAREPLSYVGVNSIGLKRSGFSDEQVNLIQEAYRYIFLRGFNTTDALAQIEKDLPDTDERNEIVSFIRTSERGIFKGPGH